MRFIHIPNTTARQFISLSAESSRGQKRQSNFEALRVVAMLMILTLHTRFEGIESVYDGTFDANHICRFGFQALSIVGMNLFVLISGYFGITLKTRKAINLLRQIVYIALICFVVKYIIFICNGEAFVFNLKWLFPVSNTVWFVPSYIMLMLFSPILNSFIDKTISTRTLSYYTMGLYAISYYWSSIWYGTIAGFDGYSWGWFIILYFTGRIIRRENDRGRLPRKFYALFGYLVVSAIIVCIAFIQNYAPVGRSLIWVYNSPLVYVSSICLFLFFCRLVIKCNRFVNWLAGSAFAVLLFHMSLLGYYQKICKLIYINNSNMDCIGLTALFIILVYFVTTIIDQPRKLLYGLLTRNLGKQFNVSISKV